MTQQPEQHDNIVSPYETTLISKSIFINQRRTSIRLEHAMWDALKEIATIEGCSIHDLCTAVSLTKNRCSSLTSSIRVLALNYFRVAATREGHQRAGHGDFSAMLRRIGLTLSAFHRQTDE